MLTEGVSLFSAVKLSWRGASVRSFVQGENERWRGDLQKCWSPVPMKEEFGSSVSP